MSGEVIDEVNHQVDHKTNGDSNIETNGQTNGHTSARDDNEMPQNVELAVDQPTSNHTNSVTSHSLRDSKGWDGKLRIERNATIHNPEALSDSEYSDEENVLHGDTIGADEGNIPNVSLALNFYFC